MKFLKSPFEYVLLIIFVLYLVLQVKMPPIIDGFIESPLGMIGIFIIIIALFIYTHPVLGVLSIFVGYELIRRSSSNILGGMGGCSSNSSSSSIKYDNTLTQEKKNEEMKKMNPPPEKSLEEIVVSTMSPIGRSDKTGDFINTTFKPIADDTNGASLF